MNPQTLITRNESGFLATELDNELVMMNLESGDYISMNAVGTDIWKILEAPASVSEIVKKLVALYEIDEEPCSAQTIQFLDELLEQGIITRS